MKFGGTSVGSADRIEIAAGLIAAEASKRPVLAVVSAMSKVTDLLLDTTRHAEAGDDSGMERNLALLEAKHRDAARALLPAAELPRVNAILADLVSEFRRIVGGMRMLAHRPPRAVDEAIAIGERLSAVLVSEYLISQGVPAEAINASDAIVTDAMFNNASPLMPLTRAKAQARLTPLLQSGLIPDRHRLQWRHCGRTAHHARPRRLRLLRFHPRLSA